MAPYPCGWKTTYQQLSSLNNQWTQIKSELSSKSSNPADPSKHSEVSSFYSVRVWPWNGSSRVRREWEQMLPLCSLLRQNENLTHRHDTTRGNAEATARPHPHRRPVCFHSDTHPHSQFSSLFLKLLPTKKTIFICFCSYFDFGIHKYLGKQIWHLAWLTAVSTFFEHRSLALLLAWGHIWCGQGVFSRISKELNYVMELFIN